MSQLNVQATVKLESTSRKLDGIKVNFDKEFLTFLGQSYQIFELLLHDTQMKKTKDLEEDTNPFSSPQ